MQTAFPTDLSLPSYSLAQDSKAGNHLFHIATNAQAIHYRKQELLIPHRKNYYFLAFVRAGSGRHWVDTTPYSLTPASLYFTAPHQVLLKEELRAVSGFNLGFTEELLALDGSGTLRQLPIIQNPRNGHELRLAPPELVFVEDLLEKIYAEYHAEKPWQYPMLLAYLHVLLVYLSRLYTEQFSGAAEEEGPVLLGRFRAKIEELYATHHDVATYAAMLHLSAGHLSEVVKAQSGKPAKAHIHERLVVEAKRRLLHTDDTSQEIAFQLGFEDASYFNRFFKRLTRQTPLQYRHAIREMYH